MREIGKRPARGRPAQTVVRFWNKKSGHEARQQKHATHDHPRRQQKLPRGADPSQWRRSRISFLALGIPVRDQWHHGHTRFKSAKTQSELWKDQRGSKRSSPGLRMSVGPLVNKPGPLPEA